MGRGEGDARAAAAAEETVMATLLVRCLVCRTVFTATSADPSLRDVVCPTCGTVGAVKRTHPDE